MMVPTGQETPIEIPITRAGPIVVEIAGGPAAGRGLDPSTTAPSSPSTACATACACCWSAVSRMLGERTWRRLLKADPAVDLVHFTILRPPERDDMTPLNELALIAFPVRELFQVKIKEFDLIILDRFQNRGILPPIYLRNIADYVRGGGGLLLSAGPEFTGNTSLSPTALGPVLPARPADVVEGLFRPQVTTLGARHPVTESLPGWLPGKEPSWGPWYRHIVPVGATGQSLMATPDGTPLLLLDHVEQGRVALLLSDQIWLWSRGHEGGGPQAELLRRIAHWLMKEPALDEEALRATVEDGTLRIERRTVQDGAPGSVTVTPPAGAPSVVPLVAGNAGQSTAVLPANDAGVYRVSDGTRSAFAAAAMTNPQEYADLRATAAVLQPLARDLWRQRAFHRRERPGATPHGTRPEASGSAWIGLPRRRDHVVTGLDAIPLLPPWAALPLLLVLVVVAWRQEGVG